MTDEEIKRIYLQLEDDVNNEIGLTSSPSYVIKYISEGGEVKTLELSQLEYRQVAAFILQHITETL